MKVRVLFCEWDLITAAQRWVVMTDGGWIEDGPYTCVVEADITCGPGMEMAICETYFKACQNVAAPWDMRRPRRSMSVGDAVEVDGVKYVCEPLGFRRLP